VRRFARFVLAGMIGAALAAAWSTALRAQSAGDGPSSSSDSTAVTISRTQRLRIQSTVGGRSYDLLIAMPAGVTPGVRYPVLYVLDAGGFFGTAVEMTRHLAAFKDLPPVIVVGVTYPREHAEGVLRLRLADFTPTNVPAEDSLHQVENAATRDRSGGAGLFARTLFEEIIPRIERRFPADPNRRVLWGYSLGGLFALTVLLRPESPFQAYLVTSPSLWWSDGWLFTAEERFARTNHRLPARVFLSVGALEQREPNDRFAMVENLRRFERQLRSRRYVGLDPSLVVFEGETHLSVVASSLTRGIRTLLHE
jgi:hypothetical protein